MPKRCIVFFDGQNLYHGAKDAWAPIPFVSGTPYAYPSYGVEALSDALVNRKPGRVLHQIRFYTGVFSPQQNQKWHDFWSNKLRFLGGRGVYVYRGRVNQGGQEKGVDVSIAVDLIRLTYERAYDVAVLVTGDHDLDPAVAMAKELAKGQGREAEFECAFAWDPVRHDPRGINGTEWVKISKDTYDACLDRTDYRVVTP